MFRLLRAKLGAACPGTLAERRQLGLAPPKPLLDWTDAGREADLPHVVAGQLGLEDDCDRPVVRELDGHAGSEDAPSHLEIVILEGPAEGLVQRLRAFGTRCMGEARPVSRA
jgi:hypothetical protein